MELRKSVKIDTGLWFPVVNHSYLQTSWYPEGSSGRCFPGMPLIVPVTKGPVRVGPAPEEGVTQTLRLVGGKQKRTSKMVVLMILSEIASEAP